MGGAPRCVTSPCLRLRFCDFVEQVCAFIQDIGTGSRKCQVSPAGRHYLSRSPSIYLSISLSLSLSLSFISRRYRDRSLTSPLTVPPLPPPQRPYLGVTWTDRYMWRCTMLSNTIEDEEGVCFMSVVLLLLLSLLLSPLFPPYILPKM